MEPRYRDAESSTFINYPCSQMWNKTETLTRASPEQQKKLWVILLRVEVARFIFVFFCCTADSRVLTSKNVIQKLWFDSKMDNAVLQLETMGTWLWSAKKRQRLRAKRKCQINSRPTMMMTMIVLLKTFWWVCSCGVLLVLVGFSFRNGEVTLYCGHTDTSHLLLYL